MNFRFTQEEKALWRRAKKVADEKIAPRAAEWDETNEISPELVNILAKAGFFRLLFPREYGGLGVSSVKICIVREELSRVCMKADVTLIMSGLGCYAIACYGTEEQKRKYIPPLASGERLGSFGLTEPGAGSDIAGIQSTAVLDGDHYILNGRKRFISSGYGADTLVVFAKTDPEKGGRGISAFIVEKGMPGFEARLMNLMFAGDEAELFFTNCRVPKENLLGVPGQGWAIALGNLNIFRPTVGASAVGTAQRAFDLALSYAKKRQAFGQPISNFQIIQFKLAEMATELDAARLLCYRAAWMADQGDDDLRKEASMAKLFATEAARRIVDQALRIHGGLGVVKGYEIERLYRFITAATIGEGTSEMQSLTIARRLLRE